MERRDHYPTDTVTGGCFLTGDYATDEGVVDLNVNLDTLPAWGRLCISPKAVRGLVTTLGWELRSEADSKLKVENKRLKAENDRMHAAVDGVLTALADGVSLSGSGVA